MLAMIMIVVQSLAAAPASAGSPCRYVGPPREAICVCTRTYCWVEPGTRYRFDVRFSDARALTETGAIGVWRPVRIRPRHAR